MEKELNSILRDIEIVKSEIERLHSYEERDIETVSQIAKSYAMLEILHDRKKYIS